MTELRDKIAAVVLDAINGVYEKSGTRAGYARAATDAIITALPYMVAPLVWHLSADHNGRIANTVVGQYAVWDDEDPRWAFSRRGGYNYIHVNDVESAIRGANAHYAAEIASAFEGVEP